MPWIELVQWILVGYGTIGFVFALFFVTAGVSRVDPSARKGSWGFRILIMPASGALWPLLLMRLIGGNGKPPEENNAHRRAAKRHAGGSA